MKIMGIYTITCLINCKIYVGKSIDVLRRKETHFRKLRGNKHGNCHLQRAWNLYGEANFKFEILVETLVEFLSSEENYWSNMLNCTNIDYGYNIQSTNPLGNGKASIETRRKISQAFIKPVIRLSSVGDFIDRFESTKELCKILSLQAYRVSAVLNRKVEHYKHFIFVFESEYDVNKIYYSKKYIRITKIVEMYTKNNILVKEFANMKEASLFVGVNPSSIKKAISKSKTHISKNYIWKFKN